MCLSNVYQGDPADDCLLYRNIAELKTEGDELVLTDIMGGREKNDLGIYSEDLASKIKGAVWFETDHALADRQTAEQKVYNFGQCVDYIAEHCGEGDLVITLGCGDAYKAAKMLAAKLRNR